MEGFVKQAFLEERGDPLTPQPSRWVNWVSQIVKVIVTVLRIVLRVEPSTPVSRLKHLDWSPGHFFLSLSVCARDRVAVQARSGSVDELLWRTGWQEKLIVGVVWLLLAWTVVHKVTLYEWV